VYTVRCGIRELEPKAEQRHGIEYSNTEVAYWIALSNMNSGVAISGMHAASVLKPSARTSELTDRLTWAANYMGRHTSVQAAPGAWVAFRAEADAGPDAFAPGRRDYTFLMRIKSLESVPVERQCGNNASGYGAWCRVLTGSESSIHLAVTADGLFSDGSSPSPVTLRLVYLPSGARGSTLGCSLQLWYVAASTRGAKLGLAVSAYTADRVVWKEAMSNISDALFGGVGPRGSDFWLTLAGGDACEARVHMVEARKPG
jgi:hypothetical protein